MVFYERIADAAGSGSVVIDWFTTGVCVRADSQRTLDYVASQHHLAGCPMRSPSGDRINLNVATDAGLVAGIRAWARAETIDRRESFRGEWYGCLRIASDEYALVVDHGHPNPHALITRDFRSWSVVGERASGLGLVVSRTIRELVREDLLARGAVMLHAAAAERPSGVGILLVGAGSAGKTSSAIRIALGGGRVVGTDRTFLLAEDGSWLAVGLPMSTRLGAGSVRSLGLAEPLRSRSPIRALNPFKDGAADQPIDGVVISGLDKVSLGNGEVWDLLGCGFTAATAAGHVVVLESAPVATPQFERLDPDDAVAAMRAHVLSPDPDYLSLWLAADPTPETAEAAFDRVAALVAERTVMRVVWDPARHCDAKTARLLFSPYRLDHDKELVGRRRRANRY